MSKNNLQKIALADLNDRLSDLIGGHESFEVWDVDVEAAFDSAQRIESEIERRRMTCRIYTSGRLLTAAAGIFYLGAGLAALASIAAHNLMTYDPDYEICRDLANSRLIVKFMKS